MPVMQTNRPTLGVLIFDTARLMRRRFEQQCRDLPMTTAQYQIVGRLSRTEGVSQAALAGVLDIEPMTLSRHVDRMEAAGLVERRPDPDDRRARRLYTTERGRALLAPMRVRADVVIEQALEGLSAPERERLFAALETIVENLSASVADDSNDRGDAEKELA